MSNNINDMIWNEIWEEIAQLEFTLDEQHMSKVNDTAIECGLHEDDDREEILHCIAEEMFEERMI